VKRSNNQNPDRRQCIDPSGFSSQYKRKQQRRADTDNPAKNAHHLRHFGATAPKPQQFAVFDKRQDGRGKSEIPPIHASARRSTESSAPVRAVRYVRDRRSSPSRISRPQ